MTQSTHQNSTLAAKSHDRNKARTDRRAICAYVAAMGADGASDEDIARSCPDILLNSLRARRGELQDKQREDGYTGYGFITDTLGEHGTSAHGKRVQKYHITAAGLRALGLDPAQHWHADMTAVGK